MGDNKLVITTEPKSLYFDLPKHADINLKDEIYSVIKHNELLAEHTIKNEIRQLLSKYKRYGNSKTYEPHKFVFILTQRLDLRSSNKHFVLQDLKNISNKLKIIAPSWND